MWEERKKPRQSKTNALRYAGKMYLTCKGRKGIDKEIVYVFMILFICLFAYYKYEMDFEGRM